MPNIKARAKPRSLAAMRTELATTVNTLLAEHPELIDIGKLQGLSERECRRAIVSEVAQRIREAQ